MTKPDELDTAVSQPWKIYDTPEAVLADAALSDAEKRRILESWEYDARELSVAEAENMGGGEANMLDRVVQALAALPAEGEKPRGPATMHGSQPAPSSAPGQGGGDDDAATLSPEEARQGEIVLKTPRRRLVFILAIVAAVILGLLLLG